MKPFTIDHSTPRRLRALLVLGAICAPLPLALVSGCMQELDPDAANGGGPGSSVDGSTGDATTAATSPASPARDAAVPPPNEDANGLTTWQLCQSPSCDLISGEVPFLDQTPPIYLPDASTTTDPCVEVEQASLAIRTTYCAGCHQAPADQAGINFVLDDTQLVTARSQSATDDAGNPEKLIVSGAPAQSWLYVRTAKGLVGGQAGMPPPTMPGYPSIPRPTAADLSVLYAWITACAPGADGGGYDLGGGGYAPPAAGTSASLDGGPEEGHD
jgi:hypothetical protein